MPVPLRIRSVITGILGLVIGAGSVGLLAFSRPIQAPNLTSTSGVNASGGVTAATSSVRGDATVFGDVNTTSVRRTVTMAFTASAATQTLAIFPLPPSNRVYTDARILATTSSNTGGLEQFTVSISNNPYATSSALGTSLVVNTTVDLSTVLNPGSWFSPTSTLPGYASSTAGTVLGDNNNPANTPRIFGPVIGLTTQYVSVRISQPTSTFSGAVFLDYVCQSQTCN